MNKKPLFIYLSLASSTETADKVDLDLDLSSRVQEGDRFRSMWHVRVSSGLKGFEDFFTSGTKQAAKRRTCHKNKRKYSGL